MKINVGYDNKLDNGDILNGTPQDFFTNPSDYRHGTPPHAWLNLVTHLRDYCNINSIELNIQELRTLSQNNLNVKLFVLGLLIGSVIQKFFSKTK